MRRLVYVDPFSRAAIWSRNLAAFALVVALIGILSARKGLDPRAALSIEGSALVVSAASILCAVVAMVVIWRTGFRGIGLALAGLVVSLLLFVYPLYLRAEAAKVPALFDVSTDFADPPSFLTSAKAEAARRNWNPPEAPSQADQALQTQLYPDIQPLVLEAEASDVDATIRKIIKTHKWEIVDSVEPLNYATGHIDVAIKQGVMGFPVDLTFRIRTLGKRTQVDIRSVARGGWMERPGANVARVQDLVNEIDQQDEES